MKLARSDAEDFLYREADLLDSFALEEWLRLFTHDAIYWLPMDNSEQPQLEPSMLRDDYKTLTMRVHQLVHKPHYAQRPRSRTIHAISNVITQPTDQNESIVRCNLMVTEMREGNYQQLGLGEQRVFSGRCEYRLRAENGLAIAMKKVTLVNRDVPIVNLSFLI